MAENENIPQTPAPSGTPEAAAGTPETIEQAAVPPEPATAAPAAGPRLRDTVWNFRSMIAVAAASLVIGGGAGAAITTLAGGDDGPDRVRITNVDGPGQRGPFGGNDGDRPEWRGGPDGSDSSS